MSQRLSGLNPLSYIGVEPLTPPALYLRTRAPTVNDSQNYNLGAIWVNKETEYIWMLVSLSGGSATWVELYPSGGPSSQLTFNADIGTATSVAFDIQMAGGTNINTSAAGSVVSFNLDEAVDITGPLTVSGIGAGVVQSNAGGVFSSSQGTDGQVLISATAGSPAWANLTAGADVVITNAGNSITISATGGGGSGTIAYVCDNAITATPSAGSVTITGVGGLPYKNIKTVGAAGPGAGNNTIIVETTPSINVPASTSDAAGVYLINGNRFVHAYGTTNTFVGSTSGNYTMTGTSNTGVGASSINSLTTGTNNTCIGDNSGTALAAGSNNTAVGSLSLVSATGSSRNTALGYNALNLCTTGSDNIALGAQALSVTTTGSSNLAIGQGAGASLAAADSNNILINNAGVSGDSHTTRIGSGQTSAFVAGVYDVAISTPKFTFNNSTNQIGGVPTGVPALPGTIQLSGLTLGSLVCGSAGVVSSVTPGVAGTVLTSTGTGSLPVWGSGGGGGTDAFLYVQTTNAPEVVGYTYSGYPGPGPYYPTGLITYNLGSSVGLTKFYDRSASGNQFSGTTWTCPKSGIWNITVSYTFNNLLISQGLNIANLIGYNAFSSCALINVGLTLVDGVNPSNSGVYGTSAANPGSTYFVVNYDAYTVSFNGLIQASATATATCFGQIIGGILLNSIPGLDTNQPFGVGPISTPLSPSFAFPGYINPINATFIQGFFVSS